jgi:hypothetical protein
MASRRLSRSDITRSCGGSRKLPHPELSRPGGSKKLSQSDLILHPWDLYQDKKPRSSRPSSSGTAWSVYTELIREQRRILIDPMGHVYDVLARAGETAAQTSVAFTNDTDATPPTDNSRRYNTRREPIAPPQHCKKIRLNRSSTCVTIAHGKAVPVIRHISPRGLKNRLRHSSSYTKQPIEADIMPCEEAVHRTIIVPRLPDKPKRGNMIHIIWYPPSSTTQPQCPPPQRPPSQSSPKRRWTLLRDSTVATRLHAGVPSQSSPKRRWALLRDSTVATRLHLGMPTIADIGCSHDQWLQ